MKKTKNELNIAFSLGSIIDTKKAEHELEVHGLDGFYQILKKSMDGNEIFLPGPSLGLFFALRKLNRSVPDDILKINFSLVSKINPNPSIQKVIFDSMEHYLNENVSEGESILGNYGFDMVAFTGGKSLIPFLSDSVFKTDLIFTTSEESARHFFLNKIPSVCIPNENKEMNLELYNKREGEIVIFSDFDGVVADDEAEAVYQDAKNRNESNPLEVFYKFEQDNRNNPMKLGPLGRTIKKLSSIVKSELKDENGNELLNITVVTARSGQAMYRFNDTIERNEIAISELYMMDGENKNSILSALASIHKGKNLFFFDDSVVHFTRSKALTDISSGWVPNKTNIKDS